LLLTDNGDPFTALQKPDGSFMPFAATPEEIEAALQEPGQHRLGAYKGDAIRTRLAEDAWTAPGRGAVER
jgi:hypothetical protein